MRNIILLIFTVITVLSCTKIDRMQCGEVYIDHRLNEMVDEYIMEASKRGIDVKPHIEQMTHIRINPYIQFPTLGWATRDGKKIEIAEFMQIDDLALKAVLFHELSHSALKKPHCVVCDKTVIMSPISPDTFSIYADEAFWQEKLDEMFSQ